MSKLSDKEVIRSWKKNAKPWIKAIQQGQIQSRINTTNKSIIEAVHSISGNSVIDIGCGEGWLMRELSDLKFSVSGLDVVPELIKKARECGSGNLYTMAYEDISTRTIVEKFDIAVCNFSLIGKESTEHLIRTLPYLLKPNGHLIIQTLHPVSVCEDKAYSDGWRVGSWAGFSDEFSKPAPWYFRTIESWITLLKDNNYDLVNCKEPKDLQTGKPISLIITAKILTSSSDCAIS